MIFINPFEPGISRLLIEDAVLSKVGALRQTSPSASEAGGILLGFRRDTHLHVARATSPGPGDRRSTYRFVREDESHARTALLEWSRSRETMDYVGEWHTHPEAHPQPSSLDMQEWRKICKRRRELMVFIIQGTISSWVGVGMDQAIKVAMPA